MSSSAVVPARASVQPFLNEDLKRGIFHVALSATVGAFGAHFFTLIPAAGGALCGGVRVASDALIRKETENVFESSAIERIGKTVFRIFTSAFLGAMSINLTGYSVTVLTSAIFGLTFVAGMCLMSVASVLIGSHFSSQINPSVI